MSKEGVAAIECMGDSRFLMVFKLNGRVHAGEAEIFAVILPGNNRIELLIVESCHAGGSLFVLHYPVGKSPLQVFLFHLGSRSVCFSSSLMLFQHLGKNFLKFFVIAEDMYCPLRIFSRSLKVNNPNIVTTNSQ